MRNQDHKAMRNRVPISYASSVDRIYQSRSWNAIRNKMFRGHEMIDGHRLFYKEARETHYRMRLLPDLRPLRRRLRSIP